MGAIELNEKKVNSNVFPNLEKAITILGDTYDIGKNLKSKLPNNFNYRSTVSDIVSKINDLKSEVKKIDKDIENKIKKVNKIEGKKTSSISKLATLVAKLGNDDVNFGKVKINNTTSKFKGDVVNNNIGKNVKKDLSDTGAKTTNSFSSKLKEFGTKVGNKIKKVGANISNGFNSLITSLKKNKELATDWIKEKFEEAKNKSDEILKSTGAKIKKVEQTVITKTKEYTKWKNEVKKKIGASAVNAAVSVSKAIVGLGENVVDLLSLGLSGVGTLFSGTTDIINGISTGNWDWKETKVLWDDTKSFVANEWTNKVYDKFYNTDFGKSLDEYAYSPFKSDGMACQIIEGIATVLGIIGITVATAGVGGVAVGAGAMATTATAVGFSKYTSEEWNKNGVSLNYQGEDVNVSINYEKYSEIEKLKQGQSTTINQQITLEDGSIQELTFTLTANGDGTYKITDNVGNAATLNNLEESSTVKGLVVGGIKGAWDGAQWFVGSKIGTGQFSKVTSGIKNEISKKLTTSGIRVGLDTLTGIVEVPFQSLVTMFSENKTWKEAWESQGGWSAVATQAGIAGISSIAGEAFDLKKVLKMDNSNTIDNISDNVSKSTNVTQKTIDEQIANANYYTKKGNFVGINVTSLDDITLDQLKKIDDIDNTFFNYNGKNYSFIEMRNLLESNQNVAKVVDVKPKTIDEQIANANYYTKKGNFVGINVTSLDDITLDQLKKIDDIDNTFFNYNGKQYTVTDIRNMLTNQSSLKRSLINSVSEISDPMLKARKLYMELNKKLHYSMDYIKGSGDLKKKILDNYTSFDNLNSSNKVVCKGWSELYAEALENSGFSKDSVRVIKSGDHRWVEIDLQNGYIILADATEAINGSIDLAASKGGFETSGFILINNSSGSFNGVRPRDIVLNENNNNFIKNNNDIMLNMDKQLGYAGENGYYVDELTKAKKLFGNNIKNENQKTKLIQKLFDMEIPKNMDGYEIFAYYRKISKNLLGDKYRDIQMNTLYMKTNGGIEAVNYIAYFSSEGDTMIQLYSDSMGKQRFNSWEESRQYIDSLNIMKEGELYGG